MIAILLGRATLQVNHTGACDMNTIKNLASIGIVISLILFLYSCYLRFTTQEEYFAWLWNCSPQVQYVTGWAAAIGFISIVILMNHTED